MNAVTGRASGYDLGPYCCSYNKDIDRTEKNQIKMQAISQCAFYNCWYCYFNNISSLFHSWVIWKSSRMQLNCYIFLYLLMTKFIVLWRLWFFSCTILFFCQKKLLCPYHSVHFWFLLWCDYSCSENIIFKNIF